MTDAIPRLNAALEGRYRIDRELGEGGMATVYLADDLKHERKVALKVLKPELAAVVGAERFLAEIKTTANLQHPHILPLYDSGEAGSFLFYVMPHVQGETLRERLDREKQLPVDDAVRLATSIGGALDYAHRHGVVHRDIKPANILMQDGQPLVGDFGIALAVGSAGGARLTETGLSVGTPYYMSPEQATGDQVIGPASDIYALGAVLYELLTGEPPYMGTTAQSVLGKIIQGQPVSATAMRRAVPAHVDAAVRKALEKLPADRFASASEFAKALSDPAFRHGVETAGAGTGPSPWRWVAVALALITVLLGAGLARASLRPEPLRSVERFLMPFRPGEELTFRFGAGFALSPDGSMLVYRHDFGSGQVLAVRRWDDLSAVPIRDTEGGGRPRVSPDGLEVVFQAGGEVKALSLAGGPTRVLAEGVDPFWARDGYVYLSTDSGSARVPVGGGTLEPLSRLEEGDSRHRVDDVLPGERHALLTAFKTNTAEFPELRVLDLRTGEQTTIVPVGGDGRYLSSGHLLYTPDGSTLMAIRFDPRRLETIGTPVPVLAGLQAWSLSDDGKLFYTTGTSFADPVLDRLVQLLWVDRSGESAPVDSAWTFRQGGADTGWSLTPDGAMVALRERTQDGNDIWIKQLDTGPRSRLTFGASEERMPVWRPGTRDVAFLSDQLGGLDVWIQPADRTREASLLWDFERDIATVRWSPDGTWLVARTGGPAGAEGGRDIFAFRPGVDSTATPILADPGYDEINPVISPDGRFIAYQTTETDRHEIYVRPFPDVSSGRWQVSVDGGRNPRWAHSGRELFFQGPSEEMMVVDVTLEPTFRASSPRMLFETPADWIAADLTGVFYEPAPDDQRFLVARAAPAGSVAAPEEVILVNNFVEELKRLVPR